MKRREFAKSMGYCALCAGSTGVLLSGCQAPLEVQEFSLNDQREIVVPKAVFTGQENPYMLVAHPELGLPISLLQVSPDEFTACLMSCTHQKCQTVYSDAYYVCPCHGARFTHAGKVIKGPATENLTTFTVTTSDQDIRIKL